LAPGTYTAAQLGLSVGGYNTFYVEAIKVSDAVADATVLFEFKADSSATAWKSDQVRLTTTRIELQGKGYGESEFNEVDRLIVSDLSAAPAFGLTRGAFQVHRIVVHDPRGTGVSEIRVGDQTLSLQASGGKYVSAEFVVIAPGAQTSWSVPYQQVTLASDRVDVSYNPTKPKIKRVKVLAPPAQFLEFESVMEAKVLEMKRNNAWRHHPLYANLTTETGFGLELNKRVAAALHGNGRWLADVYVDVITRKVLHVGLNPPNGMNQPRIQQIDFVHMADGQNPFVVNDVWDLNRISSFHDLKATADGYLVGAQKARYEALNAKHRKDSKLYTTTPPELFRNGQWVRNDKHDARVFIYGIIGLSATGVVGVAAYGTTDEFEAVLAQFRKVVHRSTVQPGSTLAWYAQSANNLSQKLVDMEHLASLMVDFLSSDVDHESLDALRVGLTYLAMEDYLEAFVGGP